MSLEPELAGPLEGPLAPDAEIAHVIARARALLESANVTEIRQSGWPTEITGWRFSNRWWTAKPPFSRPRPGL
jgi:hypothetical protein